jgi:hypothetical protein
VAESAMYSSTALTYTANTANLGNGTIAVYVVNELTVPNTVVNNDISINVFVSMGEDFEVAQPECDDVSRFRLTLPQTEEVLPQAEEAPPEEHQRIDSDPYNAETIDQAGLKLTILDDTNLIHFGESIRSFRQLLKRYNLHENLPVALSAVANDDVIINRIRQSLPFEPGYANSSGSVTYTLVGGEYAYAQMTLMRYLSLAYTGWRGSVRWFHDYSGLTFQHRNCTYLASREANPSENLNSELVVASSSNSAVIQAALNDLYLDVNGQQGLCVSNSEVNPTTNFEVPFYSNYRFAPCKREAEFDGTESLAMPYYETLYRTKVNTTTSTIQTYCASGEDFNLFFYTGPPILYYEVAYPTF